MARSYDYSPVHRAAEVTGIVAFSTLMALLTLGCARGLAGPFSEHAWWVVPVAGLMGLLAADFISGFFHFLADNFGHEELPVLGPNVIGPFREHHVDPQAMTRHDFVETNGNNCLICLPFLTPIYLVLDPASNLLALVFCAWWVSFNGMVLMTNQFHKWAHLDEVPRWIGWLQDRQLILSPEHHGLHHTPPFDSYYCITTGWLNWPLERIRFFQRIEAAVRWLTGPRSGAETRE